MTDINVGAISEALNNKADRDLVNSTPPYLKTTYVNGTSGYNIWSNGYCEQWGVTSYGVSSFKVSLAKNFANTNYFVVCNIESKIAGTGGFEKASGTNSKTVSGFNIDLDSNHRTVWIAMGYLAEGQY